MKTVRYWLSAIISDLLIAILLYTWQAEGIDQAGNVIVFWMWFITATRILIGISSDKNTFVDRPRPVGFAKYNGITEFLTISAMVWIGYAWLPAIYLVGALLMEGARYREPKTKGAAA